MIKCAVRHIQLILRGASDPALQQELNEIDVCSTSDAVSTTFDKHNYCLSWRKNIMFVERPHRDL